MSAGTALILAGRRPGGDPFAARAGVSHKALIRVGGVPMVARVVRALKDSGRVARIAIAIEDPRPLQDLVELAQDIACGHVEIVPAAASPSATVRAVLADFRGPWPLLVTTADHALLTPEMIRLVIDTAPSDADAVAGIIDAQTLHRAYPHARRTLLRFSDGAIKGSNLFLFTSPAAQGLVAFWQAGEQYRKQPWRLVARIGPLTALRFVLGRLTLEETLRHLSRLTGARIGLVRLPMAQAALDVDDEEDQALAEAVLRNAGN